MLSSKNVKITIQNDTAADQVLTGMSITWPQATNGNLNNQTQRDTRSITRQPAVARLPPRLPLLGTTAKRTIKAGKRRLAVYFQNNVGTNASNYTGSATFNPFGPVTTLP